MLDFITGMYSSQYPGKDFNIIMSDVHYMAHVKHNYFHWQSIFLIVGFQVNRKNTKIFTSLYFDFTLFLSKFYCFKNSTHLQILIILAGVIINLLTHPIGEIVRNSLNIETMMKNARIKQEVVERKNK